MAHDRNKIPVASSYMPQVLLDIIGTKMGKKVRLIIARSTTTPLIGWLKHSPLLSLTAARFLLYIP